MLQYAANELKNGFKCAASWFRILSGSDANRISRGIRRTHKLVFTLDMLTNSNLFVYLILSHIKGLGACIAIGYDSLR